ncbi:MAG TPA: hypothetical protein VHA06_06555, partial [Candidatus Angelobacter sp.]|nr:hypothetical protein [Candidatus Angelobacter sp.]
MNRPPNEYGIKGVDIGKAIAEIKDGEFPFGKKGAASRQFFAAPHFPTHPLTRKAGVILCPTVMLPGTSRICESIRSPQFLGQQLF